MWWKIDLWFSYSYNTRSSPHCTKWCASSPIGFGPWKNPAALVQVTGSSTNNDILCLLCYNGRTHRPLVAILLSNQYFLHLDHHNTLSPVLSVVVSCLDTWDLVHVIYIISCIMPVGKCLIICTISCVIIIEIICVVHVILTWLVEIMTWYLVVPYVWCVVIVHVHLVEIVRMDDMCNDYNICLVELQHTMHSVSTRSHSSIYVLLLFYVTLCVYLGEIPSRDLIYNCPTQILYHKSLRKSTSHDGRVQPESREFPRSWYLTTWSFHATLAKLTSLREVYEYYWEHNITIESQ